MTFKLYPYQQAMVDALQDGRLFTQVFGRALRPSAWHLMQSDPCDDVSSWFEHQQLYPHVVEFSLVGSPRMGKTIQLYEQLREAQAKGDKSAVAFFSNNINRQYGKFAGKP